MESLLHITSLKARFVARLKESGLVVLLPCGLVALFFIVEAHKRYIMEEINPVLLSLPKSVGLDPDALLPAESKYETRFVSLPCFRRGCETFPIERALEEYHREPIGYALALAELNTEVFEVTRLRNPRTLRNFVGSLLLQRKSRDVLGQDTHAYEDWFDGLSVLQIFRYWKIKLTEILNSRRERYFRIGESGEFSEIVSLMAWEKKFHNFRKNVNLFCQYAGSEADYLALPGETINNLRKFASDRRQELAPLLEVNACLNKDLTSYKRINAALQTRHTIEKLIFELPDTEQYNVPGSGPKWEILWNQIWVDAGENETNPFHDLWSRSTGEYARNNIRDKGRALFADMSGEIHGYDQGRRNTFDYEHFDASARRVATILHENPTFNERTGDVDWPREIRKYPVTWPAENNPALTRLQRLESRVTDLEDRLNRAKHELDQERTHEQEIQVQRERDRLANNNVQEGDAGLNSLFGAQE